MEKTIHKILHHTVRVIELSIAVILLIGLLGLCMSLFTQIQGFFKIHDSADSFKSLLSYAFTLIIGIEFVKMILLPTTNTVVEVLVFAITRTLIMDHSSGVSNLLNVLAVTILFAAKKFLFSDLKIDNNKKSSTNMRIFQKIPNESYSETDIN